MGVRHVIDQLIGRQSGDPALLRPQSTAGRALDFGQHGQFRIAIGKRGQHRSAQAGRAHQPDGGGDGNRGNGHTIKRQSQAPAHGVHITAHFEHLRNAAPDHGVDGVHAGKQRPGIVQPQPAVCHLVGEEQVQALVDANKR